MKTAYNAEYALKIGRSALIAPSMYQAPPLKSSRSAEEQLLNALLAQLAEVPCVDVAHICINQEIAGRDIDIEIDLRLPGGTDLLLVGEVKSVGEPRVARAAVDYLFYLTHRMRPGAYGVFLAPYISPEAAAICEADGFGYLDLAGNCLLKFGQVYVRLEGRPKDASRKRHLRSVYSPKSERVLRALLCEPQRSWRLQELAEAAAVSLGQVHNVKSILHNREWLVAGEGGLRLREPERLLMEWSSHYDFDRSEKQGYFSLHEPGETEQILAEICAREGWIYAFTGFSGAARIAPHARYQRVHCYVDAEHIRTLADLAGLKPVTTGANVSLLVPYDEGVFYGAQDRAGCVVSPTQIYLDLRTLPGRGEDAAEFLLDTVLRSQW